MNSKAGVAAVDRAFDILHAFQHEKPVLTLAEISRVTGLYKSTILRLMGSLEKYGFVWQRADGSYQLGAGIAALSSVFQDAFDLRHFVEPILEELVAATAESASFFVRDGDYQVCLFRVEGRHNIRDYALRQGNRRPLNRGAASTVLLNHGDLPYGPLTPENACVVSIGNVDADMAAVGVPVFGSGHKLVGALTLSGPSARFTEEYARKLCPVIIDAAARLSANLGEAPARFAQVRAG